MTILQNVVDGAMSFTTIWRISTLTSPVASPGQRAAEPAAAAPLLGRAPALLLHQLPHRPRLLRPHLQVTREQ